MKGDKRNACRHLVGKSVRNRPRPRWVDNIKRGYMVWIYLVHNRDPSRVLVNMVMNPQLP
jgi:hypothetical protein